MTYAELSRAFESKARVMKSQEQKQATYDYILAELIGKSVSRIYNSSNKMPTIAEAYPSLFDSKELEEKTKAKKEELSALRFKQFAMNHNARFKEVSNNK